MATLKFNNLQKIYPNKVQAVFDFNLDIQDKEFIVFVGPSGCGKSTTLRMVAGLEDISDGELFIDNKLVNFVDPKDRNIAMVFQSYALYPHMTVYNNIAFSLKIRKTDRPLFTVTEEWKETNKKLSSTRRLLLKTSKKISKHQDRPELAEKQKALREEVRALVETLTKLEEPLKGISQVMIKRNVTKIQKINCEINKLEKEINKISNKTKNVDEHYLSSRKIELSSKKRELEETNKELDYYKNNEVVLTKYRHMTSNEIFVEVLHASEILDLFAYLDRKPAALSGGQRQRVALGRAIVRKPKVFLMDEPLSNLDAKLRTQTRTEISHIHKAVGATTIYVTHDQVEALTLADRIVIMKDGRIQQVCTPKEAFEEPANIFVGGFIGSPSMKFLTGVFDGKTLQISKDLKISLSKKMITSLKDYVKKEVVIGIRPEYMYLKDEYNGKGATAEVKLSFNEYELVGHEYILYFDIEGQKLTAKVSSDVDLNKNKTADYVIDLDKAHLFDKETTLVIK